MGHSSLAFKNSQHVNPERDNYNVDKITRCWKCDLLFECRKGLLRHLKEHNVDLPYKCYLCDASYDTRMDSLQHKVILYLTMTMTMTMMMMMVTVVVLIIIIKMPISILFLNDCYF